LFVGLLLAAAWPQVIASEPAPKAPSANESAVLKRILGNWRAREARVKTFYVAWDSRWVLPNNRGAGVAQGRTEFWMAGNTRYRLVNSPPPIQEPQQAGRAGGWRHTFDGVTNRTLDSAYRIGPLGLRKTISDVICAVLPPSRTAFKRNRSGLLPKINAEKLAFLHMGD